MGCAHGMGTALKTAKMERSKMVLYGITLCHIYCFLNKAFQLNISAKTPSKTLLTLR